MRLCRATMRIIRSTRLKRQSGETFGAQGPFAEKAMAWYTKGVKGPMYGEGERCVAMRPKGCPTKRGFASQRWPRRPVEGVSARPARWRVSRAP